MLCILANQMNSCLSDSMTLVFLFSGRSVDWENFSQGTLPPPPLAGSGSVHVICLAISVTCFCTHTYSKHRWGWCTLRNRSSHRLVIVLTHLFHLWLKSTSRITSLPTHHKPQTNYSGHTREGWCKWTSLSGAAKKVFLLRHLCKTSLSYF